METKILIEPVAYHLLKYNILLRINSFHRQRRVAIRRYVTKQCSVTAYYNYLDLKKNDSRDIPASVLRAFANALGVPMELLFNDTK